MTYISHNFTNFDPTYNGPIGYIPPIGDYYLCVKGAERKPTKAQIDAVVVTFQILDGPEKDKEFNIWYNIYHPNSKAATIASEGLGKIYYYTIGNKPGVNGFDMSQTYFKPFKATFEMTTSEKNGKEYPALRNLDFASNAPKQEAAPAASKPTTAPWAS